MDDSFRRETVIDLLIRQEELACDFYRRCARKFPERADLWKPLIEAEEIHARFLKEIAADPAAARAFGERRAFAVNPLRIMLGTLRRQVDAFEGPGATLAAALAMARDMESSVLERKALDPNPGDPPAVAKKIAQMSSETCDHHAMVESALEALKS